ncbi:MAG: DMT family transporter [Bacteroidota bacterium]
MPTLFLILATLFWGASFMLIKIALREIPPFAFIFFRFLSASACLLPSLGYLQEKVNGQDLIRGAGIGLFLGGLIIFQTLGLQTVTASVSAFLTGFSVVFMLVIRFFVQRRLPSFLDIIATLACVWGLGLVTHSHGLTWEPGVRYSLLAALFMALHTQALAVYANSSSLSVLTLVQMLVITLLAGLAALASEGKLQVPTQASTWGAILGCAVLCTALTFWIQAYAQQHLSALKVSMILTLEPVFATLFAWLFLGETLQLSFYLGAGLILGAIGLINWRLQEPSS